MIILMKCQVGKSNDLNKWVLISKRLKLSKNNLIYNHLTNLNGNMINSSIQHKNKRKIINHLIQQIKNITIPIQLHSHSLKITLKSTKLSSHKKHSLKK